MHEWFLFNMYVDASRCILYICACTHKKMKKKCTKKEARVATIHGHVCLCSSLFLIKDSNIHILCYKTNVFNIRPFTYIHQE
jgi:hypothetical protein